jgi:hypothetical protein
VSGVWIALRWVSGMGEFHISNQRNDIFGETDQTVKCDSAHITEQTLNKNNQLNERLLKIKQWTKNKNGN